MAESLKKLTVSYGAFSCTLEGFDDPFPVMKQVVDYFQSLADRDPSFGAHPERPDAAYLRSLAERTAGGEKVEAELHEGGVILRQTGDATDDFAGMDVVEETIVVEPSRPEEPVAGEAGEPAHAEQPTEPAESVGPADMAEDFAVLSALPEDAGDERETETPAPASEAAAQEPAAETEALATPEETREQPELDEIAALHADMERFETEPAIDMLPGAEETGTADAEPADLPATGGGEETAAADDTGERAPDEAGEPAELSSRLPDWATDLIRPAEKGDFDSEFDVVDFGDTDRQAEGAGSDALEEGMNGTGSAAPASTDPEDAALERLLRVTESRRVEPAQETPATQDPLSEIRESVLGLSARQEASESEDAPHDAVPGEEEATEAEDLADLEALDGSGAQDQPPALDALHDLRQTLISETAGEQEPPSEGEPEPAADAPGKPEGAHERAEPLTLAKPMRVLEPLKLTAAFRVPDEAVSDTQEEASLDPGMEGSPAAADELVLDAEEMAEEEEEESERAERGNFRLVHSRQPESEEPHEPLELDQSDDGLSLEKFARKVGAASLPELLEASAAYTTIVAGQTRFSRRSIMGMLDEFNASKRYSQEARIKSFGKLIRSGTILRVEDGQFAISRSAKYDYETKIGA